MNVIWNRGARCERPANNLSPLLLEPVTGIGAQLEISGMQFHVRPLLCKPDPRSAVPAFLLLFFKVH